MANNTIQVTEGMADFIKWADDKGIDEVRRIIREYLDEIKDQYEKSDKSHIDDGFKWDAALEYNDGIDQWKYGGDCNMCRKYKYCATQCRPNRLLKKIAHPRLYQLYLEENPEAAAKQVSGMDTEKLMKSLGVI